MTNHTTDSQRGADVEGRIETDLATYRMVTITCPKCKGRRFLVGRSILETCPQCCGMGEYDVLVKEQPASSTTVDDAQNGTERVMNDLMTERENLRTDARIGRIEHEK